MKTRLLTLLAILMLFACEKESIQQLPIEDDLNEESFRKAPKIDVCHYDEEEDTYKIINISKNAWKAHKRHGDVRLDDQDGDGYVPYNACGYGNMGDCNENNADIHPGAEDLCGDGIDSDCSGEDEICVSYPEISWTFSGSYCPNGWVYLPEEDGKIIFMRLCQQGSNGVTFFNLNTRLSTPPSGCSRGGYPILSGTVTIRQGNQEENGILIDHPGGGPVDTNGESVYVSSFKIQDGPITAILTSWEISDTFACD